MKKPTRKTPRKPVRKTDTPPRRPVVLLSGDRRLNDTELFEALSALHDAHPVLLAIRQMFTEHIENAMGQVSRPELAESPGALAHTAGGLEWLRFLAQDFEDVRLGHRATRQGVQGEGQE